MDTKLREFATEVQIKYLDAIEKCGGVAPAAKFLKVHRSSVQRSMAALKKAAALRGHSPAHDMTKVVPDGFKVKGVSTYYNKEGKASGQWVKSSADDERRMEIMREAISAMCEDLPKALPVTAPTIQSNSLCNLLVFTDYHLGMLAWHKEGGADWDLAIAEKLMLDSFLYLIDNAPKAGTLVLCIQGDFMHTDGLLPLTPAHKHVLDAAGRYPKIVDIAIRVIRQMIRHSLETHVNVHLVICEGNHDEIGSMWMRKLFSVVYENESRLSVNDSELPYYAFQWGEVMLGFHHGHKCKPNELPLLFATMFSAMWGATTKRYGHCGHLHHSEEKGHSGMVVTQHETLAANDAHGARAGYMSERVANLVTYHASCGRVATTNVRPEMFAA